MARAETQLDQLLSEHAMLVARHGTAALAAELTEGQLRRGLRWKDKHLCQVLRPRFLARSRYRALASGARVVASGLGRLVRGLLRSPELRAQCALPLEAEMAVAVDGHVAHCESFGRFDAHMDGAEPRFLEFNPLPFGPIDGDALTSLFDELPTISGLRERFALGSMKVAPALASGVHLASVPSPRRGLRHVIGVLDRGDWPAPEGDDWPTMEPVLTSYGFSVAHGLAGDFAYEGGSLRLAGKSVQLLHSNHFLDLVRAHGPMHPIVVALRDGGARVLNGLGYAFLSSLKTMFAVLSDPGEPARTLVPDADIVARYLPWTRRVRPGRTSIARSEVDLLDLLAGQRERFVLKPAFGSSGDGVVVGRDVEEPVWQQALTRALTYPHVVQEYVAPSVGRYPTLGGDEQERYEDLCPFVWGGSQIHGLISRIGRAGVLNTSRNSDASLVPIYLFDG